MMYKSNGKTNIILLIHKALDRVKIFELDKGKKREKRTSTARYVNHNHEAPLYLPKKRLCKQNWKRGLKLRTNKPQVHVKGREYLSVNRCKVQIMG